MTEEPTVYVTREIPAAGLALLEAECDVHVREGTLPPETAHVVERLAELEAEGLLCLLTDEVDAEVLGASPELSVVSTLSVGYDHVDLAAAGERGIPVGHTPGVLAETTADFAWALLLATARRVVESHEFATAGEWETWHPTLLTGRDVHGATLGVVGMGGVGTAVARRAAGFDMPVLYHTRTPDDSIEAELAEAGVDATHVAFEELLAEADVLSLHVPLTEDTYHLIGETELRRMDEDAILVNTARGPVVDTEALDRALANGWIARAGLDVTDPEPLPADHPIARHAPEKLVVTPHLASASVETRDEMARMAARNLLAGLRGEELPHSAGSG